MFRKVLIANRGAIACRIIRTLHKMGVGSVAVYSDADRHSLHVRQADEAIRLGPAPAAQSYLSIEAVLKAARETGAEAIHPGYGFLSEKPEFAEACEQAGIAFIGPTSEQMRAFALKHTARALAADLGLPLLPGTGLLRDLNEAQAEAERIGYPLMLKSTAGGGGIGMRLCRNAEDLASAFDAVRRQGAASFGDGSAFLERFIEQARHLEVQIFGDGAGTVVALGERDCSAQRRNQKVLEETPAPHVSDETRERLFDAAVRLGQSVHYRSAGTVEFVYDNATDEFFFLEVNTRLQVEHGVTEEVSGIDLVEWMVRQASGDLSPLSDLPVQATGCSIEARLYAEDAGRDFGPSAGRLTHVSFPPDVRVETWVEPGTEVTPYYDPMIAKVIVKGKDRTEALAALSTALGETRLGGIETNLDYLRKVCASPEFASGAVTTSFLGRFPYARTAIEVIGGGTQTTVQDYPARLGFWNVGVPPSGPMDSLAFRLANRLVGNDEGAAGLEMAVTGPQLRFGCNASVALVGAQMDATLDGVPVAFGQAFPVPAGGVLKIGTANGPGLRAYLAVGGGLDVGDYLGSSATFMLGGFGGHDGRALRAGDVLHLKDPGAGGGADALPPDVTPAYVNAWQIGVTYGPARGTGLFLGRRHRHALQHRLAGPPSVGPDRRPAARSQAAVGAARRRGCGSAPLQPPRQRLCHWGRGLHRRHAHPARTRWPESGRLRLPRRHRPRRTLEDGPVAPRRHGPLPRRHLRPGRGDGAAARRGRIYASLPTARPAPGRGCADRAGHSFHPARDGYGAGRGHAGGRRPLPADRVRPERAGPGAAPPGPRPGRAASRPVAAGDH